MITRALRSSNSNYASTLERVCESGDSASGYGSIHSFFPLITAPAHRYQPENIMILPDVHFEGILKCPSPVKVTGSAGNTTAPGPLTADQVLKEEDRTSTVGMYYPGAIYKDPAGKELISANTGHFGPLDSLEGVTKMQSMNVFTSADGGK